MKIILHESIQIIVDAGEESVKVGTTVQKKNITFPTASKLHRKIIKIGN